MDLTTAMQQAGAFKNATKIQQGDTFGFDGGLNIMDSPMLVKSGQLLGCLNFEPSVNGGYRRFDGFERLDGHPSPSDTTFVSLGVAPTFHPGVGGTLLELSSVFTNATLLVGDGTHTTAAFPSNFYSATQLYRTDWQGKQPLYGLGRQNIVTNSQTIGGAGWTNVGVTVDSTTGTAPDGTSTMVQVHQTTAGVYSYTWTPCPMVANQVYVCSMYIKAGTAALTRFQFWDSTFTNGWVVQTIVWTAGVPTLGSNPGVISGSGKITAMGGGIYRVEFAFNSGPYTLLNFSYEPDVSRGTATTSMWGAQFESYIFGRATSYIKTTGSAVAVTDYFISGTTANFPAAIPVGATITWDGFGYGAHGEICYMDTINHFVVATNIVGTFIGSGTTVATFSGGDGTSVTTSPPFLNGGISDTVTAQYYLAKFTYLQGSIGPVGGAASAGDVHGAWPYLGATYAFRDNAAGTAADMWKTTPTGWQKVALGTKVRFNAGVYTASMQPPPEGTVLVGATSGATMTIKRLATQLGSWGTDAQGYFIVSSITGTPTPNELLKVGGVTYMTYLSSAPQTLRIGGEYHFRNYNFNASENPATGFRMYGVNGIDFGFEYDQYTNTFVQIETGMSDDTPDHLEVHADYLFYAFSGGSLQNSGYQRPIIWNAVFGADARSVGEDVTFLREDVSETLIIGTRRRVWQLTGISTELFQIKVFSANTGAFKFSDENPGHIVFVEDRGITTVEAAASYGNFEASSLSDKILDIVTNLIATDQIVGAAVTRKKNIYRIMFRSGTVLCLAVNVDGTFGGWTQGSYPRTPTCYVSGFGQAVTSGPQVERCLMGSSDGYVYEMDKGRSFDGETVQYFLRFTYYDSRRPDMFKRYRMLTVDVQPEGSSILQIGVDYDYGNRTGQVNQSLNFSGDGGFWNVATWDQFVWSASVYTQAKLKVEGEGVNIGLFFSGQGINDSPITLYSASLQWSPRVINRNTGNG